MPITVTPTDATLGAIVTDVDLATLDDATWQEIHAAFLDHGLLVFQGQNLDEEAQGAFALRFGNTEKLSPRQNRPTVQFSNKKADGSLVQPGDEPYKLMKGNEGWHTDSTYMPLAAKAGMLMALVVPPEGGETEFADMRAAYEALDPQMQQKLDGLSVYHSLYRSQARAGFKHKTDQFYGFHDKGAPLRPGHQDAPGNRPQVHLHRSARLRHRGDERGRVRGIADQAHGRRLSAAAHLQTCLASGRPRGLG